MTNETDDNNIVLVTPVRSIDWNKWHTGITTGINSFNWRGVEDFCTENNIVALGDEEPLTETNIRNRALKLAELLISIHEGIVSVADARTRIDEKTKIYIYNDVPVIEFSLSSRCSGMNPRIRIEIVDATENNPNWILVECCIFMQEY